MIRLTVEQKALVRAGKAVKVCDDGDELVLVRSDVFERLQRCEYDRSSWSAEELDVVREESVNLLDQFGKSQ